MPCGFCPSARRSFGGPSSGGVCSFRASSHPSCAASWPATPVPSGAGCARPAFSVRSVCSRRPWRALSLAMTLWRFPTAGVMSSSPWTSRVPCWPPMWRRRACSVPSCWRRTWLANWGAIALVWSPLPGRPFCRRRSPWTMVRCWLRWTSSTRTSYPRAERTLRPPSVPVRKPSAKRRDFRGRLLLFRTGKNLMRTAWRRRVKRVRPVSASSPWVWARRRDRRFRSARANSCAINPARWSNRVSTPPACGRSRK